MCPLSTALPPRARRPEAAATFARLQALGAADTTAPVAEVVSALTAAIRELDALRTILRRYRDVP